MNTQCHETQCHNYQVQAIGPKKYIQYLPLALIIVAGITGWVSLEKDVEAGQKEQLKIVKTVKDNQKTIQQVQTDVAVIKERQRQQSETAKEIKEDVKMILREIRKE
jgi:hypothetical protein